jgi:PBP1b-binding outer membrane lipoprotein LpoB
MKFTIVFALICFALLLGGCADQSLTADEENTTSQAPAPYTPPYSPDRNSDPNSLDPTNHGPSTPSASSNTRY